MCPGNSWLSKLHQSTEEGMMHEVTKTCPVPSHCLCFPRHGSEVTSSQAMTALLFVSAAASAPSPACVVKARNPNHSSTTTAVRVKRVGSSTDRGLASPSVILHGDSFFLCSVLFRCPFLRPQKARGGGSHPTESLSYVKAFCRTVRAACLCLLATGALPLSLV